MCPPVIRLTWRPLFTGCWNTAVVTVYLSRPDWLTRQRAEIWDEEKALQHKGLVIEGNDPD